MDFSNLLNVAEAQRRTTLTEPTVRARIREGPIKTTRIGGFVFIIAEHLEDYLRQDPEERYPAPIARTP
jgi:helix-turn-helix protein